MAYPAIDTKPPRRNYTRTAADRAAIGERNRLNKRKYPVGYDTKSRLYRIWRAMHFRCYKPSHEAFPRYGGRGIKVCAEWVRDYTAFMDWALGNGYAADLTIDRRDNDLGYEPDNCRWITMQAQSLNKRDNAAPVAIFGETKLIVEWVADPRCVVKVSVFRHRLTRGWPAEDALTSPEEEAHRPVSITAFGETKGPEAWLLDPRCRVGLATIYWRQRKGWDGELLLTQVPRPSATKDATHCVRGHEFAPENTSFEPSGRRRCRQCMRISEAKRAPRRLTRCR